MRKPSSFAFRIEVPIAPFSFFLTSAPKMRLSPVILFPLAASAANIVMSNDDGWAEINIRAFFNSLIAAGEKALISGPAENKSGTGQ